MSKRTGSRRQSSLGYSFILVERFDQHHDEYTSPNYNEAQLRVEFLNPFFSALGWDVENKQGHAEAYKEVISEDAIKIGGATKAPNYSFRIGGTRKFFLEAKKPSVDVTSDLLPAFQLRRYAWSAKLPLSILSDFEEFSVYDCRIKPSQKDKASTGRVQLLKYTDYLDKWEQLWSTFSKEAVLKGSFDSFAVSARGKKGTEEVDDAFLGEIESWRRELARGLALRNPKLTQRELNFAVQRTIDRIIFLRICEDRSIENYGQLQGLINGERTYKQLIDLYYRAGEKYNSGLFHFSPEKDRPELPDELSLDLHIDDKVLKDIIGRLYYPDCPYEFSVLPADILGQVYEQFLGKVIRLTPSHQAKVEDKPEVKKAGGVYYTSTYIVDYIVKNKLGKCLEAEGMTPKQVAKLRVLDPACGSGSFLIVAYQTLLDWHLDFYVKDGSEKWSTGRNPSIYRVTGGDWRLTTAERKRILLNNLYGVDIDPQAVEVTKLSLLLKVLEGESEESITQQLKLFHQRALPDLGGNIKCGNSLIGKELLDGAQLGLLNDDQNNRVNLFDWNNNFPEVLKTGGFDVVIGNPPYIRIQALKEWAPLEVEFCKSRYLSASSGNYDIYVVFVEKALSLLAEGGVLGFILPHKFFNAQYGEQLRTILAKGKHVQCIIHFGDQQVFANATTYTCLLFLSKTKSEGCQFTSVSDLEQWRLNGKSSVMQIPSSEISPSEWNFAVGSGSSVLKKLSTIPTKLGSIVEGIFQGIRTSANEVYVVEVVSSSGKKVSAFSEFLQDKHNLEKPLLRRFLQGRDIRRYRLNATTKAVIIPYTLHGGQAAVIPCEEMRRTFPETYDYLLRCKPHLEDPEKGRMKGKREWYAYIYPKNIEVMQRAKILVPDIANKASFALDAEGDFALTSGYALVLKDNLQISALFVLGLLNSRLLNTYWKSTSTPMRGGFFRNFTQHLEILPIQIPNLNLPRERERYNKILVDVQSMIELHRALGDAETDHEKSVIERQIDAVDCQINRCVYELYGLSEEEVKTIEDEG